MLYHIWPIFTSLCTFRPYLVTIPFFHSFVSFTFQGPYFTLSRVISVINMWNRLTNGNLFLSFTYMSILRCFYYLIGLFNLFVVISLFFSFLLSFAYCFILLIYMGIVIVVIYSYLFLASFSDPNSMTYFYVLGY